MTRHIYKPHSYHLLAFAEIKKLCGPPPVLTSESLAAYESMMFRLIECFEPRDFMEQMFIKYLADETWEILRLSRHKTLLMERRHRQSKQAQACPKQQATHPALKEVDAMLLQAATEIDHADALERGIDYAERLDMLLNAATKRRDKVLAQFDQYKEEFGGRRWAGRCPVTNFDVGDHAQRIKETEAYVNSCQEAFFADVLAETKEGKTPPASSDCQATDRETPAVSSGSEIKQDGPSLSSSGGDSNGR